MLNLKSKRCRTHNPKDFDSFRVSEFGKDFSATFASSLCYICMLKLEYIIERSDSLFYESISWFKTYWFITNWIFNKFHWTPIHRTPSLFTFCIEDDFLFLLLLRSPFSGVHAVLKMVIDYLRETTDDVVDDDILRSFRDYTDHRNRLLNRGAR